MPLPYHDQTTARVQRIMGIPLGDGRTFKNGVITSAADNASAEATRATNAAYDAEIRANAVPLNQRSQPDASSQFIRQQLLAMGGAVEGRTYNPQTLSRATDAQVAGELSALKPRNEFLDAQLKRDTGRAELRAPVPGFQTYQEAASTLPPGVQGDFVQDAKTGRWRVGSAKPMEKPPALGEIMDVNGVPFVRTNPNQITPLPKEKPPEPLSPTAKIQADLSRAIADGRTEDADALRQQIANETNPAGRPLTVMEFNFSPELRKQYGGDYGRYQRAFSDQAKTAQPTAAAKPSAKPAAEPTRVTDRSAYDALPPGSRYIDTQGHIAIKGSKPAATNSNPSRPIPPAVRAAMDAAGS